MSILLYSTTVYAQQNDQSATLKGEVHNPETTEPVFGATVSVLAEEDSLLVTGTVTDEDGSFELDGITPGLYIIRVTYIGYHPYYENHEIGPEQEIKDLGVLEIIPASEELDEIRVEAERSRVTVESDRTIYNADQMVSGTGSTATQMLEEIPSVEIDMEGNVSYRGSSSVVIQVNGRAIPENTEARRAYLQNIPSENIENIEIISNPSASEDPEGVGGIINIQLREERQAGLTGRLNGEVDSRGGYSPGFSMGYNTSSLNLFGTYTYRNLPMERGLDEEREYFGDNPYLMHQSGLEDFLADHQSATLTTNYKLTESSTINLENYFGFATMDNDIVREHRFEQAGQGFSDRNMNMSQDRSGSITNNSLSFEHNIGDAHSVEAEASMMFIDQEVELNRNVAFPDQEDQNYGQETFMNISMGDINAETSYNNRLFDKIQLESGLEYRHRNTNQMLDDPNISLTDYDYQIRTSSAYTTLNHNMDPLSIEAGVRFEHANVMFDYIDSGAKSEYDQQYVNLFPSTSLGYQINDRNQLSLNYSRRINRPDIIQLLPDLSIINPDPTYEFTGNPELDPELTNSFELTYSNTGSAYSLSLQPYLRYTTDVIRNQFLELEDEVLRYTFKNLSSRTDIGGQIMSDVTIAQSLNLNTSFDVYQADIDGTEYGEDIESRSWGWNASGNISYRFPFGLAVQAMGQYQSPLDIEQGWRGSQKSLHLAFRQGFLSNQLQVAINVRDIFDTMGVEHKIETDQMRHYTDNTFHQRSVTLSISYSFGGEQQQQQVEPDSPDMLF